MTSITLDDQEKLNKKLLKLMAVNPNSAEERIAMLKLLKDGADPSTTNEKSYTILHLSAIL